MIFFRIDLVVLWGIPTRLCLSGNKRVLNGKMDKRIPTEGSRVKRSKQCFLHNWVFVIDGGV